MRTGTAKGVRNAYRKSGSTDGLKSWARKIARGDWDLAKAIRAWLSRKGCRC